MQLMFQNSVRPSFLKIGILLLFLYVNHRYLRFEETWGMPHALGAIDGKHCKVNKFDRAGSTLFNYKNFHSVVLLAVADSQYR